MVSPAEPRFDVLPRRNLRDEAAEQIRGQIIAGSLEPGVLYSMSTIAARLGVSATPVREAVLQLAQEDLLEMVHNRGFRLRELSDQDLDDIVEVRLALEVPAMGRLAERSPTPDLQEHRALAEQTVQLATDGDNVAFVMLDIRFHLGLTSLLGNPRYVQMVELLRNQTRLTALPRLQGARELVESAREHLDLLDLIEKGDRAATEALMLRHIQHARGLWAGRPERSADA